MTYPKEKNRVRENIASKFVSVHHVDGKQTLQIYLQKK
jgi:hypothetical protein